MKNHYTMLEYLITSTFDIKLFGKNVEFGLFFKSRRKNYEVHIILSCQPLDIQVQNFKMRFGQHLSIKHT